MTNATRTTVVGVFQEQQAAERAIDRLRDAGFDANNIGYAGHGKEGADEDKAKDVTTGAASGAVGGGIAGGVIGAIAAGLIPGVGPIVGAGLLAATLGGAGIGAAAGGLVGGLTGLGVSDEDAKYYDDEFRAGRTLVVVKAEGRYDEAYGILQAEGAYDVNRRAA
jgi:hydrogenase maturation factor